MSYIDLINAFERWLETNYLPISAQLLWYKLIHIFNRAGWCEWVTVDNQRLMSIMQIKNEKTFIKCRDTLIETGLFEYRKGKKGTPNQYKINTVKFTVQVTAKSTVNNTVKSTVYVTDIKEEDKESIYNNLYKKYSERMRGKIQNYERVHVVAEMQRDEDYLKLSQDDRFKLYGEIMKL